MVEELVNIRKAEGVTILFTSTQSTATPEEKQYLVQVSLSPTGILYESVASTVAVQPFKGTVGTE